MKSFSKSWAIFSAAKHHIPRGKRKDSWIPFWKDQNIEELIHERDSISQKLQFLSVMTAKGLHSTQTRKLAIIHIQSVWHSQKCCLWELCEFSQFNKQVQSSNDSVLPSPFSFDISRLLVAYVCETGGSPMSKTIFKSDNMQKWP
ncbi:hypothetical protein CEXT_338221 [Caerostris extrusa]|uniref:Uncharacterized protein n=1 Tax=Caerostris extrusa TaxID=172846 RepID=A0AAV4VCS6_CAEEX|nr:hypothetical protein CEXT_338221 [Caerostris extrusa]